MRKLLLLLCIMVLSETVSAHESTSLEDLFARWNMDPADAVVRSEKLAPGLHVLFGAGGNVVVSIGDQGVLMVDSQFAGMIPKLQAEIRELGGGDIDFTINTHWHFDHTWSRRLVAGVSH